MENDNREMITVREAAQICGLSVAVIQIVMRHGVLPQNGIGDTPLLKSDVEKYDHQRRQDKFLQERE